MVNGAEINRAMRGTIFNRLHFPLRNPAWFIFSLGMLAFAAGIIPDIDHVIAWFLGLGNGRFLHPCFNMVGIWFISCGPVLVCALLGGYAFIRVLRRGNRGRLIT